MSGFYNQGDWYMINKFSSWKRMIQSEKLSPSMGQRCNGRYDGAMNGSLWILKQIYQQGLRWWCPGSMSCLCRALVLHSLHVPAMTIIGEANGREPSFQPKKRQAQTGNNNGGSGGDKWMKAKFLSSKRQSPIPAQPEPSNS